LKIEQQIKLKKQKAIKQTTKIVTALNTGYEKNI